MKEFIEKLIGRLEEEKSDNFVSAVLNEPYSMGICHTIEKSIEIVNQLAEEYKDNVMINGQYCWQTCGDTEHCKECNRLCNGSIDYYENYDVLAEEYINCSTDTSTNTSSGWIPTSERLPEKNAIVLTCDKDGWISVKVNLPYAGVKNDFECGYYTAWMPLPEPFKPKGE